MNKLAAIERAPTPPPMPTHGPRKGPGFTEFVVLMAALMSLNAFAIDAMLPALPAIGDALGVADSNRRQLVVTFYMIGFGVAQLVWGPLSDRYGRRPVLVSALLLYSGFALLAGIAASFSLLLAARLLQGSAAAATRVLVVSMVRDRFEGAVMARVMSLTFIVFMLVPVLAPSFGTLVLLVASWRAIFWGFAVWGAAMLAWAWLRLPETLNPADRRLISVAAVRGAAAETLSNRTSIGYTLAVMLMMGALMGYINSIQQIVFDVFRKPHLLPLVFAAVAGPMAAASFANSRLVESVGVRRMAHGGLLAFTAMAAAHLLIAVSFGENLVVFMIMQGLTMASFGLASSNMGAIAMQPLGHIAGTASSVQGSLQTIGAALLGALVGQGFNGTTLPLLSGFTLLGAAAMAVLWWTERGAVFGAPGEVPV